VFLGKDCKCQDPVYNLFSCCRDREDSPGFAAYKRIKEWASKQYEFTPKVLTPAIFEKTLLQQPSLVSSSQAPRPADATPQKPGGYQKGSSLQHNK